jgi:hypothetical protein
MRTLVVKSETSPEIFVKHNPDWSGAVEINVGGLGGVITVDGEKLLSGEPLDCFGPPVQLDNGVWITRPDLMRLVTVHAVKAKIIGDLQRFLDGVGVP